MAGVFIKEGTQRQRQRLGWGQAREPGGQPRATRGWEEAKKASFPRLGRQPGP